MIRVEEHGFKNMPPLDAATRLYAPIHGGDHVRGPATAEHTLVEYGDYECPDCGRLFEVTRDLQARLPESLRICYRHYTLSGIHTNAQQAAEAAEAAGAQGRFWEMHDLLFRNRNSLKRKNLLAYAESLALDMDRFSRELKGGVYEARVREDFRRGVRNGVNRTPGLFLNNVRHEGAWDGNSLFQMLTQTANAGR